MKLQRKLTNKEWDEIVKEGPGVRNYRGKKTLFYNGEILYEDDEEIFGPLVHDWEERKSWEVIIILPGVEVIPWRNFYECDNVKLVIMADTVRRIEHHAFLQCHSLQFVKLSRNLEFIGHEAFWCCSSLSSVFIPPSCREIEDNAFDCCPKLIILIIPPHTQLGYNVISNTALIEASTFETNEYGAYSDNVGVNAWIKSINNGEGLALHRICSSNTPNTEQIYQVVKEHGLRAMKHPNSIDITPSQYLAANPYSEIEEDKLVKRYVLEMMGEFVQEQA